MAAVTHRVSTPSTSNASSYASGAFTPAVGDLLVVFVAASGTVAAGSVTNSQGITFTKVTSTTKASGADTHYLFVADSLVTNAVSQTCTFDCTGDSATGAIVSVESISGMSRTGSSAVKKSGVQSNLAAGGTPTVSLGSAALTGNPLIGSMFNATSTASKITQPSGWTELVDAAGYSTPSAGVELASINSGFTGSSVTWGSTSASISCSIVAEFDATTAPTPKTLTASVGAAVRADRTATASLGAYIDDGKPVVISTTQVILGTSATPGAQSITVPTDAQLAVVTASCAPASAPASLAVTSSFSGAFTMAHGTLQDTAFIGYALVTATGAQTITPVWNDSILEGPNFFVSFIKGINTSDYLRDMQHAENGCNSNVSSVVLATETSDLVLAIDTQDINIPTTISGFTSIATGNETGTYQAEGCRLQSCDAPNATSTTITGTATTCSAIAAISIKPGSGATAKTITASLGAAVQAARTATASLGAAIRADQTRTASLGTVVAQRNTMTASVAAAVRAAQTRTASVGAAVLAGQTRTSSLSSAIRDARTANANLSAAVRAAFSTSSNVGAAIREARTVAASLGSYIEAALGYTKSASIDALIKTSGSATASLGAYIATGTPNTSLLSLSAAIQSAKTAQSNLSAAIRQANAAQASVGAAVRAGRTTTASLGSMVQLARTATASIGATISVARAVQAGSSAAIRDGHVASAALSAVISDGASITISPASLERLREIWARMELDPANPVVITGTTLEFGTVMQAIGATGASRSGSTLVSTKDQDAAILEVWQRLGLDPDNPMSQTATSIDAGAIHLDITEVSGTVTVTRA